MTEGVRFNQHPVISILFWILGTESNIHINETYNNNVVKYHADDIEHGSHSGATLKWKDDDGGNIHEYMSQVQISRPIVLLTSGTTESNATTMNQDQDRTTQLKPESVKEESRGIYKTDSDDKYSDIYDNSRFSESPQWGFYVAM